MRLILSRKGFDSTAGGCASPILPDGSMVSLPIPDSNSPVRYGDLRWRRGDLGDLVSRLTRGRLRPGHRAHLDPDLRPSALARPPGWRPSFGQKDAAQGHLRAQGVGPGDLFVFWGLFRRLDEHLRWTGPPLHVAWGWLQIAEILSVDREVRGNAKRAWLADHPHVHLGTNPTNTLYLATKRLALPGTEATLPGARAFARYASRRRLTAKDAPGPSLWSLPAAFLPRGRPPLTYHKRAVRWTQRSGCALLQTVSRGQEFVLDLDLYPDVLAWVGDLLGARA